MRHIPPEVIDPVGPAHGLWPLNRRHEAAPCDDSALTADAPHMMTAEALSAFLDTLYAAATT
jgi:hypothetical protein